KTLSEDLIFRAALPVAGGRGGAEDGPYDAQHKVSWNNFQGRYIIRHSFQGAVKCARPRYGVWGASQKDPDLRAPSVAKDLANTPRGTVSLRDVVQSALPRLGLPGKSPPQR